MATTLPIPFKKLLSCLERHSVEYMVLGGYAVAFHGYPRATADFGVWVRATSENARRAYRAMSDFDFPLDQISEDSLAEPGTGIRMGVPPLRLELTNFATGLECKAAQANMLRAQLDDLEVNMISLEDLKTNKRATGRNKDLADLDHLPGGHLEQRSLRDD